MNKIYTVQLTKYVCETVEVEIEDSECASEDYLIDQAWDMAEVSWDGQKTVREERSSRVIRSAPCLPYWTTNDVKIDGYYWVRRIESHEDTTVIWLTKEGWKAGMFKGSRWERWSEPIRPPTTP